MTNQKQLSELPRNHVTNLTHLDGLNTSSNAFKPLALEGIYATINSCNYRLKNMSKTSSSWELQSTTKAQELITRWHLSPTEFFFRAVERGNFEEVQRLLDSGTDIEVKADCDYTVLIFAASSGRTKAVKFLLDRGANVNARDSWDHTPLLLAAHNGHTEIVSILLSHGAEVNAKDKDGDTALASASRENHKDIVKLLINPAQSIQIQKNFDSAREAMSRMSKRVYENMIGSERGEELLAKAEKYNISYKADSINWLKLINEVETYEELLSEADEYNIAWDLSEYDPVGLQQEIEYCVSAGRSETNDLHRYYFDSRL